MNKGNSADYAAGRITPEMAVGHSLQHIAQLQETLGKGAVQTAG